MNFHNTITAMNPESLQQNAPQTPETTTEKKENFFKEIVKFTLIALAIVIPIRTYIAQPFIVSGASMDPTFTTGEYLIVDQLSYNFEDPKRGDVIIFKYPVDPKTFFIKRIIGLPGETVSVRRGVPTIYNEENPDGLTLDEDYISDEHQKIETFEVVLKDGEYFVMGDNRAESSDSRIWGPLDEKYIIGRPLIRLFPVTNISVFPGREWKK